MGVTSGKKHREARECWISYDKDGSKRVVTHNQWAIAREIESGFEVRHYREVREGGTSGEVTEKLRERLIQRIDENNALLAKTESLEAKLLSGLNHQVRATLSLPKRESLRWTKEKPTRDGWYWLRLPGASAQIEFIMRDREAGVSKWYLEDENEWVPILDGREWAGPLPRPAEPQGGEAGAAPREANQGMLEVVDFLEFVANTFEGKSLGNRARNVLAALSRPNGEAGAAPRDGEKEKE